LMSLIQAPSVRMLQHKNPTGFSSAAAVAAMAVNAAKTHNTDLRIKHPCRPNLRH
jgi:hypothetical protein